MANKEEQLTGVQSGTTDKTLLERLKKEGNIFAEEALKSGKSLDQVVNEHQVDELSVEEVDVNPNTALDSADTGANAPSADITHENPGLGG
jgi:hypothetical protein